MNSLNITKQIQLSISRKLNRYLIGLKDIAPKNAKALWAFVFIVSAVGCVSCVNEWPNPDCKETFSLNLEFDTALPKIYYDYTRAEENPVEMLYIIRAYEMNKGTVDQSSFIEFSFTRNPAEGYDCSADIKLAPGNYRLMVWADFCNQDGRSLYYDTDNFEGIRIKSPYTGDTDLRDAFCGTLDLTYNDWNSLDEGPAGIVKMTRPLAKYEFVSTDLSEFISSETRKLARGESPVWIDEYYTVLSYTQFVPDSYNFFTLRPNDATSGISFRSELKEYEDNEVLMGFDYVFVDDNESGVAVQISVFRKADNKLVARTGTIRVPLKRSHDTIVKGSFLLSNASDGVGIDPGYDGDFVIFAPLE